MVAITICTSTMAKFCPAQTLGPYEKANSERESLVSLETPFWNLIGLNSSASGPHTSLSRCNISNGIDMIVPFGTLMLARMVSEEVFLCMKVMGQ